ncbi:TRM-domain-containing protein [Polyplosphaeria fusca]|uniref:tRNA (guanine(26)-N(2))-dimethyltransferase n=1 Tax=Polyplosphaeria fusca TaxID=682080 RepID=A0A9P4UVU4_9PLEO|nr:TRM-domain-containing protein [Polyplosphaeria fusca]
MEPDHSIHNIDAVPEAGANVTHDGKNYTTIKEGLAYILVPHGIPTSTDPRLSKEDVQRQQVFYNPIQQFNRDLSVLAIKTFGEDFTARKHQKHSDNAEKKKKAEKKRGKKEKPIEAQEDNAPLQPDTVADVNTDSRKRKHVDDVDNVDPSQISEPTAVEQEIKKMRVDKGVDKVMHESSPRPDVQYSEDPRSYRPDFRILDALSATGLRALRYAKEIPSATAITANDMSSKATESIALNIQHNQLNDKITAHTGNAIAYMYGFVDSKIGYDVIDLDPYGTAAPFIDAAVQALNNDGLLCVTCTDSAIFASHGYLEKTYSQYGGLPLKGVPCHEGGLRLLLHAIASSAARYGKAIEPLLSLSIDYYIRVFVRIRKAPNEVKLLAGKTMIVYHCDSGCGSWSTQFLARNRPQDNRNGDTFYKHTFAQAPSSGEFCEHCGFKRHLSGPMYGGPLHNTAFIERMLAHLQQADADTYQTNERIVGMLHTAMEEMTYGVETDKRSGSEKTKQLNSLIPRVDPAELDLHPFFFIPSALAKVITCQAPPTSAVRGALMRAGYRVTMSHCKPGSIRTDASWTAIWHIMLEWARQRAPVRNPPTKGKPGHEIFAKSVLYEADKPKHGEPANHTEANAEPTVDDLDGAQSGSAEPVKETEAVPAAKPSYLNASFEVIFDEKLGKDRDRGKYVRYQIAPRENWGPMSRAK